MFYRVRDNDKKIAEPEGSAITIFSKVKNYKRMSLVVNAIKLVARCCLAVICGRSKFCAEILTTTRTLSGGALVRARCITAVTISCVRCQSVATLSIFLAIGTDVS